ncbi:MAG: DUF1465 family protein [Hyphomicrobiales bacterium]|nr:DUF1465 family protein [Hyphomicrobiales bacterium]
MSKIAPPLSQDDVNQIVALPVRARRDNHDEFFAIFREGMALVERTANYLDGPGRRQSKCLQPPAALAYATESMRLTTRLTQLATWLLARRAIINGDPVPRGSSAINPLDLPPISRVRGARGYNELPVQLRELIEEAYSFHQKLSNFGSAGRSRNERKVQNPVATQIERLQSAFA